MGNKQFQESIQICVTSFSDKPFFRIGDDFGGWLELRKQTIASLRDIADYIDSVTHKSTMVKAFGSGSGIVAGSLTLAGGILVFITFYICTVIPCSTTLLASDNRTS